jgi:hypothetical protein
MAASRDQGLGNQFAAFSAISLRINDVPKGANCWEVMNCGAENTCSAKLYSAGKKCWLVAGSYALDGYGKDNCVYLSVSDDSTARKVHRHCKECSFYELKHSGAMMPELPPAFAMAVLSRTI